MTAETNLYTYFTTIKICIMKRLCYLLLFFISFCTLHAQTVITDIEYFVNTDPGFGNGIAVPIAVDSLIDTTFTVDLLNVSNGLHQLYVRAKNSNGRWSHMTSQSFLRLVGSANGNSIITDIEYYIDTDPGYGNGIDVPFTDSDSIDLTFNIPLDSLGNGLHLLYIRAKDNTGKWSHTQTASFLRLVGNSTNQIPNIVRLEYFIDADPGYGNATAVSITPNDTLDLTFNVGLDSISQGLHALFVRALDETGKWSFVESTSFLNIVGKGTQDSTQIVQLEYFLDTDPGYGNGTQVGITPTDSLDMTFTVDLDNVSEGLHTLCIRARDDFGKWSLTQTASFLKVGGDATSDTVLLTTIEYFFDIDPGYGNGTQIQLSPSVKSIDHNFTVDLIGVTAGNHTLYIRAKDNFGKWSLMYDGIVNIVQPVVTADFTYSDNCANTAIQFTDASTAIQTITSWNWSFGDGNTSTTQNPTHTFTNPGSYAVQLIASIATDSDTLEQIIQIYNQGVLSFLDSSFQFGDLIVGNILSDTVMLYNTGCTALNINGSFGGNAYTANATNITIASKDSFELILNFVPTTIGNFVDTFTLNYNGINAQIAMNGNGQLLPNIVIYQDTISAIIVGCNDSISLPLMIVNTGQGDLNYQIKTDFFDDFENGLNRWTITGDWALTATSHSGSFGITESPNGNYGINSNHILTLTDAVEVKQANNLKIEYWLKINTEPNFDELKVEIQVNNGTWQVVESSSGTADWAKKTHSLAGYVNDSDSVRVRFRFNSDFSNSFDGVYIDDIQLIGTGSSRTWLSLTNTNGTIIPNDSTSVNLKMYSRGLLGGTYTAEIEINSNDINQPTKTVIAQLIIESDTIIALSDTLLDLTTVQIGQTNTTTLTIYNNGCDDLDVTNIILSDTAFSVTPINFIVTPADSAQLTISFTPDSIQSFTTTMILVNNFSDTSITLIGQAEGIPILAFELDTVMASVVDCGDSVTVNTYLYNTGLSDLVWEYTGTNGNINILPNIDTISAGDSTLVTFTFRSNNLSLGQHDGNLTFATNNLSNSNSQLPYEFTVNGLPQIALSDTIIDFGIPINGIDTEILTIINDGCDTLNITNITISDTIFSIGNNTFQIAPFSNYDLTISFQPVNTGLFNAQLTLDNNSNGSSIIQLVGSGCVTTPTVTANQNTTLCPDDSITLTTNLTSNIIWSTGEITPSITTNQVGNYTVTYSDSTLGCFLTSTITTIDRLPDAIIDGNENLSICLGDTITLNVLNASIYTWSTGVNSSSITAVPIIDTFFAVQASNSIGCNYVDTVWVEIVPLIQPDSVTNMFPADGTQISPPAHFSWFPANNASSYDLFIWLDSLNRPLVPSISNITNISYDYYNLQYGQDYKWQVISKNVCFEKESVEQIINIRELPDLIVSNIQTPNNPSSGQTVQISWTIDNQGSGNTGVNINWYDYIYLSPDPLFDNSDIYLTGVSNLTALTSGQGYTNSANVRLPNGIQNTFYIIVRTDRNGNIQETDNTNNDGYAAIPITLTPPPDLQVVSIIKPNTTFSSQLITFSYTVKNEGTGSTIASYWRDRIFLSPDSAYNNNATYLAQATHNGVLDVDSTYTQSVTATLPQGISGSYFLIVETDYYNNVYEFASESNNQRVSDTMGVILTPPPNLQVTNIVIPDTVSNQEQVSIQWTVTNNGASATPSSWNDRIYLSINVNGTDPISVGTQSHLGILNPTASYNGQKTITIPSSITGAYYIFIDTDYSNHVFEHVNENDNTLSSSTTMEVINADLIVSTVIVADTAYSGQILNVQWTVKNQGIGTIYGMNWFDGIYISTQNVFDINTAILIDSLPYSATLLPNQTINKQKIITLPNGIFGNYYVYVRTDKNDNIFENTNENNNTNSNNFLLLLSPSADLQVTYISPLIDSVFAGTYLPITITISNTGQSLAAATWKDKIFISVDSVWNPNKVMALDSFDRVLDINDGNSYTSSTSVNIPMLSLIVPSLDSNSICYLYIVTDYDDDVYEHGVANTNNITRSEPFYVASLPPVDMKMINAITSTDSSAAGQQILVTWTTQNIGNKTDYWNYQFWYDAIYVSQDTVWDTNDVFVTDWTISGPIDSLESYTETKTFTVPNGLTGAVYFLMVADHTNLNNDGNVGNNYKPLSTNLGQLIPIILTPVDYPDLLVDTFIASSSNGTAGQPTTIYYTVTNNGDGPTLTGSWTDKVYLSNDFTVDGSDQIIGTKARVDTLQVGDSYTDSLVITFPISASGNYILIFKTDANNSEYEDSSEVNNVFAMPTSIVQPPPSDLIAENIVPPAMGFVGELMTVQYDIRNQGSNPATGSNKDIVYLSADSTWDVSDVQFSIVQNNSNLAPQTFNTRTTTASVPGLALGDYFVIVRTDALNNIFESNDTNNLAVSTQKVVITLPELIIDSLTLDTLTNLTELYYRIEIPDSLINETLLITIEGDSINGVNELYTSFNAVPTRANHDYSQVTPFEAHQELIVPSLRKGTYYIMTYGQVSGNTTQPVTLLAEILPFEIRSVQTNQGGNTGNVTVKIEGAKFDNNMEVRLEDSTRGMVIAHSVYYINSTTIFATFDLQGESIGLYNVVLRKLNNELAILEDGFEIVTGAIGGGGNIGGDNGGNNGFSCTIDNISTEGLLNTNIQHPPNTRLNRVVAITIQYANNSNIDIPIPTRLLISTGGAPLSYVPTQFILSNQELFLEFSELNGPLDVLRPGANGSLTIYTKAIAPLSFLLKE